MIGIVCAMSEERDAILGMMKDVKVKKGKKLIYHNELLNNEYYVGKIGDRDIVLTRSGVGKVFAAINTVELINRFKPELIVNLGVAGSLNENVHINDVVVADRAADWDVDVPGWDRSLHSPQMSYPCDESFKAIFKKLRTSLTIHYGSIVSSDSFIYKKSQVNTIKRFFPEALCGEMEGSAIASTCHAYGVKCCIIRSISDEALINGNYKDFDFNLAKACEKAAELAVKIIDRYRREQ
ncbi:MAG: 5'-methylthioadenosine/adenosylhomocysteine nucleosidase [Erysipelotrichaceae bacterium]|nr:5'-methylthioadenosine/adenosylhomocysteine nucleosidase [Erysipelotrichaceae bacterium]